MLRRPNSGRTEDPEAPAGPSNSLEIPRPNPSARAVTGDLRAFSIFDVTQSLLGSRKTALVTVQSGQRKGYVYFREGQIVHALDDSLNRGEHAVMDIFAWSEGTFWIEFGVRAPERNVDMPTDLLLLELARNLDEVRHEKGIEPGEQQGEKTEAVADEMKNRVGERLRGQLSKVFRRVAGQVEPARSRYSASAFDTLLSALVDLDGSALFLRPGGRPRIKLANGFETLKDEEMSADEIEGFLHALLSDAEARTLREKKEVTTFLIANGLGSFKVTVVDEHGTRLVGFAPVGQPVPALESLKPCPTLLRTLRDLRQGVVIVGGPIGSGKGQLVDAILADHMMSRDAFAFQFSDENRHDFSLDRGFCVHRSVPEPGALHGAFRAALEQRPDILSIVGVPDHAALGYALSAAGLGRLVLFTIESHTPSDTLARLLRLCHGAFGDGLGFLAAERIRLIVDCTHARDNPDRYSYMAMGSEAVAALRNDDLETLRRLRIVTPGPKPVSV